MHTFFVNHLWSGAKCNLLSCLIAFNLLILSSKMLENFSLFFKLALFNYISFFVCLMHPFFDLFSLFILLCILFHILRDYLQKLFLYIFFFLLYLTLIFLAHQCFQILNKLNLTVWSSESKLELTAFKWKSLKFFYLYWAMWLK